MERSGQTVPPGPTARLQDNYRGNTIRNLRLRRELTEAVRALNRADIVPLLFKGSRELVDGTHDRLGERWMVDLDLAVPADEARRSLPGA